MARSTLDRSRVLRSHSPTALYSGNLCLIAPAMTNRNTRLTSTTRIRDDCGYSQKRAKALWRSAERSSIMSTAMCPNGHPVAAGDLHCGTCGAQIVPAVSSICANGHPMPADSRFCGTCGAQAPVAPAATTATVAVSAAIAPNGPEIDTTGAGRKRTLPIVIGIVVILALLGGGIAFALTSKSDDASASDRATTTTSNGPTTTLGSTTTSIDRVKAQIVAIDGILATSAVGRASLGSILADVQSRSCANDPGVAQRQILGVAENRRSTITSLQKIDGSASPAVAQMKASLLRGLEASYSSDVSYARAVGMLFQCGTLNPSNPDMAAASITDGEATAGKQAFLDAYNPIAAQYGLRSDWTPRDL